MNPQSICGKGRQWFCFTILIVILALCAPFLTAQDAARKRKSGSEPEYPALARQFKITGTTRLELLITPEGKVKNIKVLGGSPVLVKASLEAVNKWVFEPAPKESTMLVKFDFNPD